MGLYATYAAALAAVKIRDEARAALAAAIGAGCSKKRLRELQVDLEEAQSRLDYENTLHQLAWRKVKRERAARRAAWKKGNIYVI